MRFTLIKNLNKDPLMKPILLFLLIFSLLYLISDFFVKYADFGLFPMQIISTLFGDEANFVDPINPSVFLEFIHTETFFIMMLLLTLSAIYGRVSKKTTFNLLMINLTMIAALLSLISLFISFYFSSHMSVYVYVVTFFLWHLLAIYMIIYSFWKLNAKSV